METRDLIIQSAENLLMDHGFNAFSYKDIAKEVNIKTSSIHYYFPGKSDLGSAIIHRNRKALAELVLQTQGNSPIQCLDHLLNYYKKLAMKNRLCMVGVFAPDYGSLDIAVQQEAKAFADEVEQWTVAILQDGIKQKLFKPTTSVKTKARLVLSSLIGLSIAARMDSNKNFIDEALSALLTDILK